MPRIASLLRVLYLTFPKHAYADEHAILLELRKYCAEVCMLDLRRDIAFSASEHFDILLCHQNVRLSHTVVRNFRGIKVCWWFDKVRFEEDESLFHWQRARTKRLRQHLEYFDVLFLTDGDEVKSLRGSGYQHVYWLPQGFNELLTCGKQRPCTDRPVFFPATVYGQRRTLFYHKVMRELGKVVHATCSCVGRVFAADVAASRVVIAPPYPVGELYWSNRAWNVLGCGGILVHPHTNHMQSILPMVLYYQDEDECFRIVRGVLQWSEDRIEEHKRWGKEEIMRCHRYEHRVKYLLRVICDHLVSGVRG